MRRALAVAGLVACGVAACGRLSFEPLDAGGADAGTDAACAAVAADPCTTIPPLAAAPTIDGVLEPCLAPTPITPVRWTDAAPLPAGIAARAVVAWRPDGLYVYLEVDDPDLHPPPAGTDPYCGDGVEVYADDDGSYRRAGQYDDPGSVQLIFAAPDAPGVPTRRSGRWVGMTQRSEWAGEFVTVTRPGGYAFEALIDASAFPLAGWSPAGRVGLDLAVNVSTPDGSPTTTPSRDCGVRLGQFFLAAAPSGGTCGGLPFCTTAGFCAAALR